MAAMGSLTEIDGEAVKLSSTQFVKEQLNEIQPRRGRWRQVEMHARMAPQPLLDVGRLMRGIVVQDHMPLPSTLYCQVYPHWESRGSPNRRAQSGHGTSGPTRSWRPSAATRRTRWATRTPAERRRTRRPRSLVYEAGRRPASSGRTRLTGALPGTLDVRDRGLGDPPSGIAAVPGRVRRDDDLVTLEECVLAPELPQACLARQGAEQVVLLGEQLFALEHTQRCALRRPRCSRARHRWRLIVDTVETWLTG